MYSPLHPPPPPPPQLRPENHAKDIHAVCANEELEFRDVKDGGTNSNYWILKG